MTVMKSMYNNIKAYVYLHGVKSETFVSLPRVTQGEQCSPLLFSLFVNDLEEYLLENGCEPVNIGDSRIEVYLKLLLLLYADDTIIMSTTKQGLQGAMTYLCDYCKKWK